MPALLALTGFSRLMTGAGFLCSFFSLSFSLCLWPILKNLFRFDIELWSCLCGLESVSVSELYLLPGRPEPPKMLALLLPASSLSEAVPLDLGNVVLDEDAD